MTIPGGGHEDVGKYQEQDRPDVRPERLGASHQRPFGCITGWTKLAPAAFAAQPPSSACPDGL